MFFSLRALAKPKSEMISEDLQAREEEEFNTGPLTVLTHSMKTIHNLINSHNNKKILTRVKAFDHHCNMANVKEMCKEQRPGKEKKNTKPVNKDRYIPKELEHINEKIKEMDMEQRQRDISIIKEDQR
ncbi:hypothetical protein FQA39_LY18284 [Lamprigera yunnana]|nr:hypothetical protein FQA39_LY18284 [Lamprigera yunnana]